MITMFVHSMISMARGCFLHMLASALNVRLTEMSYENWLAFISQVVILARELHGRSHDQEGRCVYVQCGSIIECFW
jgi:hypothetical protein